MYCIVLVVLEDHTCLEVQTLRHIRIDELVSRINPLDKPFSIKQDLCLHIVYLLFQTYYLWERNCVCKLRTKTEALVYGNENALRGFFFFNTVITK